MEAYPGHKNNSIHTHLPLLAQHLLGFFPECPGAHGLLAGLLGFEELLRLGEEDADNSHTNGDAS